MLSAALRDMTGTELPYSRYSIMKLSILAESRLLYPLVDPRRRFEVTPECLRLGSPSVDSLPQHTTLEQVFPIFVLIFLYYIYILTRISFDI